LRAPGAFEAARPARARVRVDRRDLLAHGDDIGMAGDEIGFQRAQLGLQGAAPRFELGDGACNRLQGVFGRDHAFLVLKSSTALRAARCGRPCAARPRGNRPGLREAVVVAVEELRASRSIVATMACAVRGSKALASTWRTPSLSS
jgi:hypothetical protein